MALLAHTTVMFVQQCAAANRWIAPCIIKNDVVALWCAPSQCRHGLALFLLGPASCTVSAGLVYIYRLSPWQINMYVELEYPRCMKPQFTLQYLQQSPSSPYPDPY